MTADKITLDRSAVEQALQALYEAESLVEECQNVQIRQSAIADLQQALDQPQVEQEPVGFVRQIDIEQIAKTPSDWGAMFGKVMGFNTVPVYTHPQPQGEQEPVAWIEHEWSGSGLRHLHFERPAPTVRDEVVRPVWTPLYTHPQNLNCKSNQARLATLWGYVEPQPKREPLTDEQIKHLDFNSCSSLSFVENQLAFARAIERAHGIGVKE